MVTKGKLQLTKLFLDAAREQLAQILGVPIEALALVLDVSQDPDDMPMVRAAAELATDTFSGRYVIGNEDEAALTVWHSQDMQ